MTINIALFDVELMRYSRQLMVADIAELGQQQLILLRWDKRLD
ncbi:hypothetical protein [Photobacterium carnosum]|nr:hypothetical protein [Photobacterium carnosum]